MHQNVSNNRKVHTYSPHLFAQLPIKFLLTKAQREQKLYAGKYRSFHFCVFKLILIRFLLVVILNGWVSYVTGMARRP